MQEEAQINIDEAIDRVRGILMRRRWWILGIGASVTLATCAVLFLLPNHYLSEATLLVVQQEVPERYVASNSTADLISELETMKREILSRTQMLKLVQDFNLYEKQRKRLPPERIVELVLHNIDIQPLDPTQDRRGFTAFKIAFTAEDPALAQRVNSRLTSLFIDENLRTREQQSVSTTAFLHDQLEEKRQALEAQDKQLRDLKMRFIGELPEQEQGNLAILAALQAQLQTTGTTLTHAQEQRTYLQSLLNGYIAEATADVNQLRAKRAKLLEVYTAEYPAVVELDEEIAKAEGRLQHLVQSGPAPSGPTKGKTGAANAGAEQPAATEIKSQLEANTLEVANLSKEEARLNSEIAEYQKRLNETPEREQELLAVTRDAERLRLEYADLGKKEQESQLATNLEKNQGGQQFRLADPPSLPVIPSSPKRLKLSLQGAGAGIALGLGCALLIEVKDRSFHTESEARGRLTVPMLIGVPMIVTAAEQRSQRRRWLLECVAGCLIVVAVCVAEAVIYRKG
jgi:polysaccharide biosynthesis transport protein